MKTLKELRTENLELRENNNCHSRLNLGTTEHYSDIKLSDQKILGQTQESQEQYIDSVVTDRSSLRRHFNFGFTLIELIVVISILAILGTIAFISFSGYSTSARDSNRMSDMANIYKSLSLYGIKNSTLPMPADYAEIGSSSGVNSYQGYMNSRVLSAISITNDLKDPLDGNYYIYSVSSNKKKGEIMGYLESVDSSIKYSYFNQAYADTTDYSNRFPYAKGDSVGLFIDSTTNTPLVGGSGTTTVIDLSSSHSGTTYKVIVDNSGSGQVTGSGETLITTVRQLTSSTGTTSNGGLSCSSTTHSGYTIPSLSSNQSYTATLTGSITNGTMTTSITATCTSGTLSYSSETTSTTCNTNFVESSGSCIDDLCQGTLPTHAVLNGTQSFTGTWQYDNDNSGVCKYKCDTDYHLEGGECKSNSQSIPVSNGTCTQSWEGTIRGACTAGSCDTNYTWNAGAGTCDGSTQTATCAGSIPSGATATTATTYTQTWNGSSWTPTTSWTYGGGSCGYSCPTGYHLEGGICKSNSQSIPVTNGTCTQNWQGTIRGPCTAWTCDTNYHSESSSCMSNTRTCTITNGVGSQTRNGSARATCVATSCNSGYYGKTTASCNVCAYGARTNTNCNASTTWNATRTITSGNSTECTNTSTTNNGSCMYCSYVGRPCQVGTCYDHHCETYGGITYTTCGNFSYNTSDITSNNYCAWNSICGSNNTCGCNYGSVWNGSFCAPEYYPGCDTPNIVIGTQVWSACNLGTNTSGLSSASYGGYYQWGQGCASGYHVPTSAEWQYACDAIKGSACMNPETDSNFLSTIQNVLKLPLAGRGSYQGYGASYRSSTPVNAGAYRLLLDTVPGTVWPTNYFDRDRTTGFSVRCLK